MSKRKVEFADQINGTELAFAAAKAYVEMCENKFAPKTEYPVYWDDKALYVTRGNHVIGMIVYRDIQFQKTTWIVLSWTEFYSRRQGIYKQLYAELKKRAKYKISSGIKVENKTMQKVAESCGRKPTGIWFEEANYIPQSKA